MRLAGASAACGDKAAAQHWVGAALRARPTEPRGYLALGVLAGLLRPDPLVRFPHRHRHGS